MLFLNPAYTAANKGWSMANYHQSLAFDSPYLSCNDHCDRWLFQEIFFYYYKYFLEIILLTILNLFSWNLNTFTKLTEQVCFLFICSFLTCLGNHFILFNCV